jgi:hypothetical protein
MELTSNYLSSAIVSQVSTCRQCDYAKYAIKLQNYTADYLMGVDMGGTGGLVVKTLPGEKSMSSSVYNLKYIMGMAGSVASVEPINLTFSRTKNVLRVE